MAPNRSPLRRALPHCLPRLSAWAALSITLAPALALAQQTEVAPATTTTASSDFGSSVLQLGIGFIMVLGVLFASLWLLKRLTSPRGQAGGLMKVISTLAIGPRERVILMEVGEQWLLVGVGPGHITKLGELPRQAMPTATGAAPGTPDFAAWLKRAIERRPGQNP